MKTAIRRLGLSGGGRYDHLRAGDAARNARDWGRAEHAYKAFLDAAPKNAAIWTQYGHALKEQGKLAEAEAAYRQSVLLSPEDADAYLQLGHALKLQRRLPEAEAAYARSHRLTPTEVAREELDRMVAERRSAGDGASGSLPDPAPGRDVAQKVTYIEFDDLFGYLGRHTTLSGIQRVQVNVTRWLLSRLLAERGCGREPTYAILGYDEGAGFRCLDPAPVQQLVEYCAGDRIERDRLDQLLHGLGKGAVPARFSAGECLFIFSGFWTFKGMDRFLKPKAAGVSVGVMLYDLIPITHPEFCDAGLVSDFALSLGDGFTFFDFALTISKYSERELRRFMREHGLRPIPVETVPLSHYVKDAACPDAAVGENLAGVPAPPRRRPFVLCVCTIEARKNHAYLVACWKLLLEEGVDVPDLVFVGRHGMRVDDLLEMLRATQYLDGRVQVLHDLADAELGALYRDCLFTAFPSFIEGWGSPPGESLVHGTPCVASGNTSIPEVGGDFIDYVDPFNVRDGVAVFRRMIQDRAYRERRRADIRARFRARTWGEVGTDMLDRIGRLRLGAVPGPGAPLLHAGEVFRTGDVHVGRPVPPNYASRPLRLVLADGWYPVDHFSTWTRTGDALLRFATPYEPGTEVVVYLRLRGPSELEEAEVAISAGAEGPPHAAAFPQPALGASPSLRMLRDARVTARLLGRVGGHGIVETRLSLRGDGHGGADRGRLAFAVIALGYALRSDAATRADLAEVMAS